MWLNSSSNMFIIFSVSPSWRCRIVKTSSKTWFVPGAISPGLGGGLYLYPGFGFPNAPPPIVRSIRIAKWSKWQEKRRTYLWKQIPRSELTSNCKVAFWGYTLKWFSLVQTWNLSRPSRSCKIFVSCVKTSRKQRSFLHILQVYTHLNVNFIHSC